MAEHDQANEGTEAPTQRRRDEARKDGQVVASPDVSSAVAIFAGCLFFMWFGSGLGHKLLDAFRTWMRPIPASDWSDLHTQLGARWLSAELLSTCGMFLGLLTIVGLCVGFAQSGFLISFKPMELNFEKMSPARGWEKLFSAESGVRGLLGIAKVLGLVTVAAAIIWMRSGEFSAANFTSIGHLFGYGWKLGLTICMALAAVSLTLAVADYITRWLRHEKKLKMTHEEIKREQKDENGDPTVKAAMRRRQREGRKEQSVAEVPEATVILTNPTHYAVALKYESGRMGAPKLVAKGAGSFAANIVRIAKQNQIPVVQRPPLTRAIFRNVKVGQEIPAEFFRAVAEILGEIYRARRRIA